MKKKLESCSSLGQEDVDTFEKCLDAARNKQANHIRVNRQQLCALYICDFENVTVTEADELNDLFIWGKCSSETSGWCMALTNSFCLWDFKATMFVERKANLQINLQILLRLI